MKRLRHQKGPKYDGVHVIELRTMKAIRSVAPFSDDDVTRTRETAENTLPRPKQQWLNVNQINGWNSTVSQTETFSSAAAGAFCDVVRVPVHARVCARVELSSVDENLFPFAESRL